MKVAHVTYNLAIGGVTNVIHQLTERESDGLEQILILLMDADCLPADLHHIKIYKLNYALAGKFSLKGFIGIWLRPSRYFSEIVKKLQKIHEKEKFDVYHFHGLPKDLQIGSLLKRRTPGLKLVYTDHLMRITSGEYGCLRTKALAFLYRRFYKPYNIIFVSQTIADAASSFGFINHALKFKIIENSVNLAGSKVKSDYTLSGKTSIVFVSRISAVKGHFLLPTVAELLINKHQYRNFEFVLIGPGELTDKLKTEIAARKLDSCFRILGPMQNVPELLPGFDIAVFPSEREGLPIALLEKMAAGLPVVASDIPEIKNVIQHPDEAQLFPVNDSEACAAQLMRLVQDQSLREKTGAAARKAVEERYAEPLATRYAAFYNSLF